MRWTNHPDNAMHRCSWTQSNQRCVELYVVIAPLRKIGRADL